MVLPGQMKRMKKGLKPCSMLPAIQMRESAMVLHLSAKPVGNIKTLVFQGTKKEGLCTLHLTPRIPVAKARFGSGFPAKNVVILVVTGTGWGVDQTCCLLNDCLLQHSRNGMI